MGTTTAKLTQGTATGTAAASVTAAMQKQNAVCGRRSGRTEKGDQGLAAMSRTHPRRLAAPTLERKES